MAFAKQTVRPIDGAVATAGVDERVAFLRRTYAHVGIAVLALVAGCYAFMQTEASLKFTVWALGGRWNWLMVLGMFMAVGYVTEKWARSDTSRGIQYLGLGVAVGAEAIILTPLLYVAAIKTGDFSIIKQAAVITIAIFGGLTGIVFVTKKDFSFLRGVLGIGTMAAFGVIIAAMLFGFSLGTFFSVAMIALMAGYILYQTSQVMAYFRPTQHVAAALMLFSTIATLFWYVLQLLMSLRE